MAVIKKLLINAKKSLRKITSETQIEAEFLLCFVLKKEKEYLFINPEKEISKRAGNEFRNFLKKRITGFPLFYILGKKEFFGMNFKVNKNVLIPRVETEELIECFLEKPVSKKKNLKVADIGTGAGCVAVALAKKLPKAIIYATDSSSKALQMARLNAKRHKTLKRIKFLKGDLLDPLLQRVDVIIANLPYVSEKNYKKYFKNLKFEPKKALRGGKDGLFYIKKLIKTAPKHLKENGEIFLEISPEQKMPLKDFIKKNLPKAKINFKKDLSNRNRILHLMA